MGGNQHHKDPVRAYLFAGLAVIFWSTAASAFKLTLEQINYIQILFVATLTSCIALFAVILVQRKLPLLISVTRNELFYSALLGLLNPFLYYTVLLKAYSILPAQVAQPLNFTWPIMLVILSVPLLKQKISILSAGAMIVSFAGVYLISSQGNPFDLDFSDPFGVSLALGSSVLWALFWIYNVRDRRNEVVKLFMSFLFACVYITLLMIISGGFHSFNLYGITGAVYIGLFEMGFTFVFWLKALQFAASSDKVSNLIYITPFFALLFINIIVGEQIYLTTFGGLVLIIAGILMQKFLALENRAVRSSVK
ncbi:MAG: DMT family transporter [Bacteroidales bacterium]